MGTVHFDIKLTGLREIRRKVEHAEDELLAEPWKEAMESIGALGQRLASQGAPSGPTGRTVAMMYHRVQARPVPMWARVGTRAKAVSKASPRYPYPRRTNFDMRSPVFGWMTRAIEAAYRQAGPILERAARQIEDRWSSN